MAQAARRAHGALRQPVGVGVAREARGKDRPERGPGAVPVPDGTADLCAPRRRRALRRPSARRRDAAGTRPRRRARAARPRCRRPRARAAARRSEEHTSEIQSLMRISYAVFRLTIKKYQYKTTHTIT